MVKIVKIKFYTLNNCYIVIHFFNFSFLFLDDFNFLEIDRILAIVNVSPTIGEIARFLCSWMKREDEEGQ